MRAFDYLKEALDEAIANDSCLGLDEHIYVWQLDPVNNKTLYGVATEEGSAGFFYTLNKYEAIAKGLETLRDNLIVFGKVEGSEFDPNKAKMILEDVSVERNTIAEVIEDARKQAQFEEKAHKFSVL